MLRLPVVSSPSLISVLLVVFCCQRQNDGAGIMSNRVEAVKFHISSRYMMASCAAEIVLYEAGNRVSNSRVVQI